MIPLQLTLSGFLSYRDPVEIDFTSFELACISGSTERASHRCWTPSPGRFSARPASGTIRIDQRPVQRGMRSADLLLRRQYLPRFSAASHAIRPPCWSSTSCNQAAWTAGDRGEPTWKPLTERTLRETELRIEQTLRLDYDTFVNASFFLQGKADQFTQQRPGDRKRILGSILGLEIWEGYRQRTADLRKKVEAKSPAWTDGSTRLPPSSPKKRRGERTCRSWKAS